MARYGFTFNKLHLTTLYALRPTARRSAFWAWSSSKPMHAQRPT